jgi:hypothetical protein
MNFPSTFANIMDAPQEVDRPGAGTLRYTLTQKHQSKYLHNRETKLGINDSTSSVSVSLSSSVSLLSSSITSYMHKHTTSG